MAAEGDASVIVSLAAVPDLKNSPPPRQNDDDGEDARRAPMPDHFAAAAVRASKSFLAEGRGENFGARIDASSVAEGAAAADVLVGVRNAFAAFEFAAAKITEEEEEHKPQTEPALPPRPRPLPKHEEFVALDTAAADCEFMFSEWDVFFGDPSVAGTPVPGDAAAALERASQLLARLSEFYRAGSGDDALATTARACDCVARLATAALRAGGTEELAAALDGYVEVRFEFARLLRGGRAKKNKENAEDNGDAVVDEWHLVREIARSFALSSVRSRIQDVSWRPAFRPKLLLPDESPKTEFALGPTPETAARVRWRAAAFVGTISGIAERASSSPREIGFPRLCALRMAEDYPDLVAACCDCERSEFVLSILSAASSCVAIARKFKIAKRSDRYEQTCTRAAAIVLAGCAADRFFWGTFGGETYDFTRASWIPPARHDGTAARVSGDTTDEDEEELIRTLEAEEQDGASDGDDDADGERRRENDPWTHPARRSRDRAMHWTARVMAVVYRATELIVESLGDDDEDDLITTEAEVECELDCAMLATRAASRAMGAAADLSDRMRSGCVRDLWMARREIAVRSASGKLVAAAARRLHALATRAAAVSGGKKEERAAADEPEPNPVADAWQRALRARSFAFGADAARRVTEHETGHRRRRRIKLQNPREPGDKSKEEGEEEEQTDKTNSAPSDEDPRTRYWQQLRGVVFHTWLNGECDSAEWFPPTSSSENDEDEVEGYKTNGGGVQPWQAFAAACMPATRVTISRVGNHFPRDRSADDQRRPGTESVCGCWVDASDVATLATLVAASACCGAGARLLRSPPARVLTEAGLMWMKRLGEEDICSRLCAQTPQTPKFVRDDGVPDALAASIGVLGALTLECGAWAAAVARDAVLEEDSGDRKKQGAAEATGGKTFGDEDSSDDDDSSSDSDSDVDDDRDKRRRCAERLRSLVRWNWKPAAGTALAPHKIAVACASLAFDLAPAPNERAWKELQGLFAVALLGPSAVVYENESAWLERLGSVGTIGRCHGGLASAGVAGALEIARAARDGHLVFALRNAALWIRLECGWNAMTEALGMDRAIGISLLGAMRDEAATHSSRQLPSQDQQYPASTTLTEYASSGVFPSIFGRLRAIYYKAHGPVPIVRPGRDENALTNVVVPGGDIEEEAAPASSERCRRAVRRALIAVQTITDVRCPRKSRPIGRAKIDSAVHCPANSDRGRKFPTFLEDRIAGSHLVFARFCRRAGASAVPEIYGLLGHDARDAARADAFATRGPCELAMALGVLYARHRYPKEVGGNGKILVVKEPDAAAIAEVISLIHRTYSGSTAQRAAARTLVATISARARLNFPTADPDETFLKNLGFFAPETSAPLPFATVPEAIFFSQLCGPLLIGDKTAGPVFASAADVAAACACLVATLQRVRDEKTAYDVYCIIGSCVSSLAQQNTKLGDQHKQRRWTYPLAMASFVMCAAVRLEISAMKQGFVLPAEARDVRERIADLRNCVRGILQESKVRWFCKIFF